MKSLFCFLSVVILTACSTQPKIKDPDKRSLLFPHGTYEHSVRVELKKGNVEDKRNFNFTGVANVSATTIKLVGLSPFGTTIFRITEDRATNELKFETQIESLKKNETKMRDYYKPMRDLLTVALPILETGGNLKLLKQNEIGFPENLSDQAGTFTYSLSDYDENKIPRKCRILSEKFEILIELSAYDL